MFLIFLSWIYIVFTSVNCGVWTEKILGLKNRNTVVTSILGLFSITLIASIWAVFGRINIEFHVVLLLFNLVIYYKFRRAINTSYNLFWQHILALSGALQTFLVLITLLILAQCSTLPYVIDNESYYIQTIKWLNEYGFVKGLANLHLYLGQFSGWHITQSVFNLSFLYPNFNDLSGYCLLLGVLFSIEKLQLYYKNRTLIFLITGVFTFGSIYYFQFISAPSPDIAIYVLTFIILFYFIENYKNCSSEVFNLIVALVLFMLYIKSTSIVFAILPLVLFLQNFKNLIKNLIIPSLLAGIVLVLFITKNMIVSGSVFFPSKLFESFAADYSIPKTIESNYYDAIRYFGYRVNANQFQEMSTIELLINWLSMPKLNGVFNKIGLSIIAIVPFFIYKYQNKKSFWIVYLLMVFQMALLFATSPQYRFFMNFVLFFSFFCFVCLIRNQKVIITLLYFSLVPIGFTLFIPMQLSYFTSNTFMSKTNTFPLKALLFPLENTKLGNDFEVFELGNLKYNSPLDNDFFYGTGNGALPCVNKKQIDYYQRNYDIIPQMRTNDIKDGFYSKNLLKNE
ncbi:LIC_10190 family membrane protein [Flavobacterium tegetincola]|uniref:LIC_10190 family membrane protein n=1 Tax=Flavobacterium tegetincola TaxID=150172 RepID=UPI00040D7718|nr:hypothetical protein [Flavobacterium tegetincola]